MPVKRLLSALLIGASVLSAAPLAVRADTLSDAAAIPPAMYAPPATEEAAAAIPAPAAAAKPAVTLEARVDLTRQMLTVVEAGRSVASWKISSGVEDHATPRGVFQPEWTAKMWYSHTYDGAPMPHAVFFKNGAAIHATQSIGALGRAASHGCVRLAPDHAATFYALVQRHGLTHTRVSVSGTPPPVPQMVARRPAPPVLRVRPVQVASNDGLLDGLLGAPAPTRAYGHPSFGRPNYLPPLRAR